MGVHREHTGIRSQPADTPDADEAGVTGREE
jgi:hypothetical protein